MKRRNNLREFLNQEKDRLDLTDVIFDGEDDVDIFFFKYAMPILPGVVAGFYLDRDFGEDRERKEIMFKHLKVGIVRYIYDILELLNSDNPDILSDYHDDAERLGRYEDFLINVLAYGKIDKLAEEILNDLKEDKSDHLLDVKPDKKL